MELNNFIRAFWYMSNNFGDNLNFYLIKALSKKEPVYTENRNDRHFIVCGSILSEAGYNSTVWGAGFGYADQHVNNKANVIAVRGHLSQNRIEQQVKAFGDPAILMQKFYNPNMEKSHKFGIIPHWKDLEKTIWMSPAGVKIINPLQPVESLIMEMKSCEKIISTSLHGLILADTYQIPNKWIDLGTDIGGDGFKFKDYYSTTETPEENSISLINFDECRVHKYKYSIEEFIKTCPFYHE